VLAAPPPRATLSKGELLVTSPHARKRGKGKARAGEGGKRHSQHCQEMQASPTASAGLVKLQLFCKSSSKASSPINRGSLTPDTRDAPIAGAFSKQAMQQEPTLQRRREDKSKHECSFTEPGWAMPLKWLMKTQKERKNPY